MPAAWFSPGHRRPPIRANPRPWHSQPAMLLARRLKQGEAAEAGAGCRRPCWPLAIAQANLAGSARPPMGCQRNGEAGAGGPLTATAETQIPLPRARDVQASPDRGCHRFFRRRDQALSKRGLRGTSSNREGKFVAGDTWWKVTSYPVSSGLR